VVNYLPQYFTSKAIYLYIGALVLCNILFFSQFLPIVWWVFGLLEVVGFFYFSNLLTRQWADISPKAFTKKLFTTALIIRLVWVLFSYVFYTVMTGQPFEFSVGDAKGYHETANWIRQVGLQPFLNSLEGRYSDAGYAAYLSFQYYITDSSILIARLLKALIGAITCLLVYRLATRNLGEEVGRMSAIFFMLMPNLILYTGLHLKEVEMVFLSVWFMERADYLLRSKKNNFITIVAPVVLAGSLFFFRTVLGATALFALLTGLLFSSTRGLGLGKRMLLILWVVLAAGYFVGGKISTEVEEVWMARQANQQSSLKFRAEREGGNVFSQKASVAIFAPLIFVIPFPTVINTPGQENQQMINGGNYVKNILAFFVMFAMLLIIKEKKWREYTLIGSFTIGYLLIIANSGFAHSERFHQPVLPFLMIFAAVGISKVTNSTKKYFTWYMMFLFVAIVAWSWFKLAGRGLV